MGHKRNTLMAATLVVLVGLLVGCGQTSVRLGWVETSSPGHVKATYAEFAGTETRTVPAQPGETLYLEYDAEVDYGSLHLEVEGPYGGAIWCVSLCENCGETKALPLNKAGCFTISVRGEAAEGGFDLKWEQKQPSCNPWTRMNHTWSRDQGKDQSSDPSFQSSSYLRHLL